MCVVAVLYAKLLQKIMLHYKRCLFLNFLCAILLYLQQTIILKCYGDG